MTRCGYVAIAGRPNVGKSTLMNSLIGQKLSITAHKPQTTRQIIFGIDSNDLRQLIYVDTPGIHTRRGNALNKLLNRSAGAALRDVDVVVLVVQAGCWNGADTLAYKTVCSAQRPFLIVVNKVDLLADKTRLLPYLAQLPTHARLLEVIPVSARNGEQLPLLLRVLSRSIPEGEFVFSADQITNASERFLAAEIIREQLTRQLNAELPYSLNVEIERFAVDSDLYRINAVIWVSRESQKAIVIGKKGERLKQVGTLARKAMQQLFDCKVHLKLWVRVKKNWVDDIRALHSFGYDTRR